MSPTTYSIAQKNLKRSAVGPFLGFSDGYSPNVDAELLKESAIDIINPQPGQYSNYSQTIIYPNGTTYDGWWNVSYTEYIQPHIINTTHLVIRPVYPNGTFWCTVNTTNRFVADASPDFWWRGSWYVFWIETNVSVGTTIRWWFETAKVIGEKTLYVAGRYVDCWVVNSSYPSIYYQFSYYDKKTGLMAMYEYDAPGQVHADFVLNATNIPIGKIATAVYFNLSPNPAKVGEPVTLKGILVDEFSRPLANEIVRIYGRSLSGRWRFVADVQTTEYGVILLWWSGMPKKGTFVFAVYYAGSEMYYSCYNFAVLIVR